FFRRLVDGVIKRGAAARPHSVNASLESGHVTGEFRNRLRIVIEAHEQHAVLFGTHDVIHEPGRRLLLEAKLRGDAVAGVDQERDAQRQIAFGGELPDKLRFLVFDELEIVDREVGDEAAFLIGDREQNVDRRGARTKSHFGLTGVDATRLLRPQRDSKKTYRHPQRYRPKPAHMHYSTLTSGKRP